MVHLTGMDHPGGTWAQGPSEALGREGLGKAMVAPLKADLEADPGPGKEGLWEAPWGECHAWVKADPQEGCLAWGA